MVVVKCSYHKTQDELSNEYQLIAITSIMNKKKKKTYYGNEPKDEDEEKLSSNLLLK